MNLVYFEQVDISRVMTENKKKGKAEKAQEITRVIIKGAKISEPSKVAFLSDLSDASSNSDSSNGDASSTTSSWISGHALKTSKDNEWLVVSSAGALHQVKEDDMMDAGKFQIKKVLLVRTTEKQAQKAKRQHAKGQCDIEVTLVEKARKARKEQDYEEYKTMCASIIAAFKMGGRVSYGFEDFKVMI
jgi:hypothetical protein